MIPTPRNDLTAHLTPSQEPPKKKNQESTEKAEIARGRTTNYRGPPAKSRKHVYRFFGFPREKHF
jgi:hypothetical protein